LSGPALKRCEVVYARPDEQICIEVQVPAEASIGDVLAAASATSGREDIPWGTESVGVYGQRCARSQIPEDGDRVEIYRDLPRDPRRVRLDAMHAERRAARRVRR